MKYYIKKYLWAIFSTLLLPGYLTLSNQRSSYDDPADKVLHPNNHLVITIDNFPEMQEDINYDGFVLSTIFGDKPIANIENGDLKIHENPILSEIWEKTHKLSKLHINLKGEVSVMGEQDQQEDDYQVPYIITSPDIFLCRVVSIIKEMIVNDQAMQKVFSRDAHIKLNRAFIPKIYKNFADLCQGSLNEFKGYIEPLKYEVLKYIDDLINCTYLLKQSLNNIKVMVNDFFEKALNPKIALNDLRDAAQNINISINKLEEIASMENIIIGYLDQNAADINAHMWNISAYINNRPLRKLAYDRQMLEDPHRRTGAYPSVREDLRSGVTTQLPSEVEFPERSNVEYISFDSMYHGILYMRSLVNEIDKICKSKSIPIRKLAHIADNLFSYQNLPSAASQFLQDFGNLYRIKDSDKKDPNVMPKLIKVLAWRTMISYTVHKNILHKNTVNKKQKIRARPIVWVYHNT